MTLASSLNLLPQLRACLPSPGGPRDQPALQSPGRGQPGLSGMGLVGAEEEGAVPRIMALAGHISSGLKPEWQWL